MMAMTPAVELVPNDPDRVSNWVQAQLGFARSFGQSYSIGVSLANNLVGGCVYHNYNPEAEVIEMSAASSSPRWLTRKTLHALLSYPFDYLKCQLIVLRVSPLNGQMIELATRVGFLGYIIPRLRGRNEDEIIFTLSEEAWRSSKFERAFHGQVQRANAA
jgi:RimJ/RimL family protein N-acetyltransferase